MQAKVPQISKANAYKIQGNCEFVFAVSLFGTYILFVFNNAVRFIFKQTNKLDTLLYYVIFALLILFSLREILKRIRYWQVLSCIGILSILFISMIFSSNPEVNLAVIKSVVLECFPVFILAGTVRDFSTLKRYIDKSAVITLYCLPLVIYVLGVGSLEVGSSYSQYMSYYVLLPTIVLAGLLLEKFSVKLLIPFFLGLFTMLSYGARGSLSCLVLYIAVKLFLAFKGNSLYKKITLVVIISASSVLLNLFFYKILGWLMNVFGSLGFSIRSVQGLANSSFFTDIGRSKIYSSCLNRIISNPFWGTGLVNDRIYITNAIYSGDSPIGNYPHNIFLEVWMQFGIFVGTILLAAIILILLKGLSSRISADAKRIVLILIGIGFFPLLFSGSYINSSSFYMLMGVCGTLIYHARWDAVKMGVFQE